MPYIKPELRPALEPTSQQNAMTPGELNFQATRLAIQYIDTHGLSYANINDVIGALTGAAMEFYRRVAVPYENVKIEQSGDVYDELLHAQL